MCCFLRFLVFVLYMVSKLDVLLAVGLFPKSESKQLLARMQKKAVAYNALHKLLKRLEEDGHIKRDGRVFLLSDNEKTRLLFWLVEFCFRHGIDYNVVVSEKTAEFVKRGLEKERIDGLPFDAKTVRRITIVLAKKGFVIIESKKPFSCRIVYSIFLERLARYFFPSVAPVCKNLVDYLNEEQVNERLEKEFSGFKKIAKQKAGFDEIEFIHSSLSLEGNTLTLSETEKLLKKNILPSSKSFLDMQQALDYKKALDAFVFSGQPISLEKILEFHRTAMNSMAAGAGQVRTQNVRIKGNPNFKTPDWKIVPQLLSTFFETLAGYEKQSKFSAVQAVEQAASLHSEFQRIHPFIDGNSRTTRAIFTKLLIEKGFSLTKIPVGFFDQYMKHTKLSEKRDDQQFALLMKQIVLENIKQAKQRIEFGD